MEEHNKTVKMSIAGGNKSNVKDETPKYTYEQLNDICVKLFQENQTLKKQLEQAIETLKSCNRLDYLFRVLDLYYSNKTSALTFNNSFIGNCLSEIEEAITVPTDNNGNVEEK